MADIVAANVTYDFSDDTDSVLQNKEFLGPGSGFRVWGTISFGNGSLTYPTGGIPLTKAKMGLPRVIKTLNVQETNAVGYVVEFDKSAETIRLFEANGSATGAVVLEELDNAPVATVLLVEATGY